MVLEVGMTYRDRVSPRTVYKVDRPGNRILTAPVDNPILKVWRELELQERIATNVERQVQAAVAPAVTFDPFRQRGRGPSRVDWGRSPLYFRMVGYLAANASHFTCSVPMRDYERFQDTYHELTGETPTYETPGIVERELSDNDIARNWEHFVYLSWRIAFKVVLADWRKPSQMQMVSGAFLVLSDGDDGRYGIAHNGLCWQLVDLGFRPGLKSQDVGAIRANVPAGWQGDFDFGVDGKLVTAL